METSIIIQDNNKGSVLIPSLIKSKIHNIRGYNVILGRDLAIMYDVTTSNLNKAVKRNIDRFPGVVMLAGLLNSLKAINPIGFVKPNNK